MIVTVINDAPRSRRRELARSNDGTYMPQIFGATDRGTGERFVDIEAGTLDGSVRVRFTREEARYLARTLAERFAADAALEAGRS